MEVARPIYDLANHVYRSGRKTSIVINVLHYLCLSWIGETLFSGGTAAAEALSSVPSHLAPVLLQEAMMSVYTSAIANIIANWPLPTLW